MNKELIKKYWNEFVHWKDDGKLLHKDHSDGTWLNVTTPQFNSGEYIINDKYVELRKALAEGKTIQAYSPDEHGGDGTWTDTDTIDENYLAVDEYRIKPNEPTFKVGDYVVCKGIYNNVTQQHQTQIIKIVPFFTDEPDEYHCQGNTYRYIASSTSGVVAKQSFIAKWTLEEADDDEWVLQRTNRSDKFYRLVPAKVAKTNNKLGESHTVPDINGVAKQLGLEK